MFTNYVQHVDCDPSSRWRRSRDFVSSWMNFFVFDNGFQPCTTSTRPALEPDEAGARAHRAPAGPAAAGELDLQLRVQDLRAQAATLALGSRGLGGLKGRPEPPALRERVDDEPGALGDRRRRGVHHEQPLFVGAGPRALLLERRRLDRNERQQAGVGDRTSRGEPAGAPLRGQQNRAPPPVEQRPLDGVGERGRADPAAPPARRYRPRRRTSGAAPSR